MLIHIHTYIHIYISHICVPFILYHTHKHISDMTHLLCQTQVLWKNIILNHWDIGLHSAL